MILSFRGILRCVVSSLGAMVPMCSINHGASWGSVPFCNTAYSLSSNQASTNDEGVRAQSKDPQNDGSGPAAPGSSHSYVEQLSFEGYAPHDVIQSHGTCAKRSTAVHTCSWERLTAARHGKHLGGSSVPLGGCDFLQTFFQIPLPKPGFGDAIRSSAHLWRRWRP
jgi:hypothetical protein